MRLRMDKWFIPEWKIAHKLWTVRIAIFWAIVSGLYYALPAFQEWFSPIHFALLSVGFSLALLFARITKQTGVDF